MKAIKSKTLNNIPCIAFPYKYGFVDSGNDMSRILTNLKTGACIIGAMRSEYTLEENLKRTEALENDLMANGFGYRPSIGGFVENKDTPSEVEVEELSFIVPYNKNKMSEEEFYDKMLELCKKYNQESILISLPSINNGKACYVNSNGDIDISFNKIGFPKKPTYYTKPIKHNTPKFEFSDEYDIVKVEDINLEEVAKYYGQYSIRLNPNSALPRLYDNGWYKG